MGVPGFNREFCKSIDCIDRYNIIDDKKTTTVVIGFQ